MELCPYSGSNSVINKEKIGQSTGLENEPCNLDKDEQQSTKSLKYYTQNFFDKEIIQNRGVFFHSGFNSVPPPCKIDDDTSARFGKMTNINLVQNLPALPLPTTASYYKGQGPVQVEDYIRPQHDRSLKQCNPKDSEFYNRSFYIFDSLPVKPNECWENYVQTGPSYRQGVDTRHSLNKYYKNNCKLKK